MKQLPKYFCIKRDADNPLWEKYIQWLKDTYCPKAHVCFKGDGSGLYYGWAGSEHYHKMYGKIKDFPNPVEEITLEQWDEAVNGFVLPEKWCVKVEEKNKSKIYPYLLEKYKEIHKWIENPHYCKKYLYSESVKELMSPKYASFIFLEEFKEITLEQFEKYVLNQENKMEKQIIGYKLVKTEYIFAAEEIANKGIQAENNGFRYWFRDGILLKGASISIGNLKRVGVLDLWFEPVYQEQFKVGDWVVWTGHNPVTGQIKSGPDEEGCYQLGGKYERTHNSLHPNYLRKATEEEIEKAKEKVISVGGKFDVTIRDGRVFHKSDDITQFVRSMIDYYVNKKDRFGGTYIAAVKDVTFSKTGCQEVETTLSDWKKVYDELTK